MTGIDNPDEYRLGDGDRALANSATAFIEHLKSSRPAEITNAERDADKKEIAALKEKTDMLERVATSHAQHIRTLRGQIQTLSNAVAELQRRSRPARAAAPIRKRDHLDDELERDLYR